jgi:hypothetical protein
MDSQPLCPIEQFSVQVSGPLIEHSRPPLPGQESPCQAGMQAEALK